MLVRFRGLYFEAHEFKREVLTRQDRQDAIRDARREHVRPLHDRLVGDADGGRSPSRATEEVECLGLGHASIIHSSPPASTMVRGGTDTLATMVKTSRVDGQSEPSPDYRDRLAAAMKRAGLDPDQGDRREAVKAMHALKDHLGVSYQAVKKVLDRGSNALTAENNSKVAAFLKVSSDWLATGEGRMDAVPWPFPLIDRERFDALDDAMKGYIQRALEDALERVESKTGKQPSHKKTIAEQIEEIQPTLPPGIVAMPERRSLVGRQVTGGTGSINKRRRKEDGEPQKGTG